jgi:hypothetical protein
MYNFNFFSVLSLLIAQIYFDLGIYILAKNFKGLANKLFFLTALTMAIWGLGEGMERASVNATDAMFWAQYIVGFGSAFHSSLLLHFWLVFSGQTLKLKKRWFVYSIYLPGTIFFIVRTFFPSLILKGVKSEYWGFFNRR